MPEDSPTPVASSNLSQPIHHFEREYGRQARLTIWESSFIVHWFSGTLFIHAVSRCGCP